MPASVQTLPPMKGWFLQSWQMDQILSRAASLHSHRLTLTRSKSRCKTTSIGFFLKKIDVKFESVVSTK